MVWNAYIRTENQMTVVDVWVPALRSTFRYSTDLQLAWTLERDLFDVLASQKVIPLGSSLALTLPRQMANQGPPPQLNCTARWPRCIS